MLNYCLLLNHCLKNSKAAKHPKIGYFCCAVGIVLSWNYMTTDKATAFFKAIDFDNRKAKQSNLARRIKRPTSMLVFSLKILLCYTVS